jgi:hypothetical protein
MLWILGLILAVEVHKNMDDIEKYWSKYVLSYTIQYSGNYIEANGVKFVS